jgi:hypothetical protein
MTPSDWLVDGCSADNEFCGITRCCSLKQCYHIYCISRNGYTEEEIDQAARSVGKSTAMSIMREMFGGWYQKLTGWKKA